MGLLEKLLDMGFGGVAFVAAGAVPAHVRRQAKARVGDFNPFDNISANHDLKRAVRVTWIEDAMCGKWEW